mgnify:CR=1 FL=1
MTGTAGGGCRASVNTSAYSVCAGGGHAGTEWPTRDFDPRRGGSPPCHSVIGGKPHPSSSINQSTSTSSRAGGRAHLFYISPLLCPSARWQARAHATSPPTCSDGAPSTAGGGCPASVAEATPPRVRPAGLASLQRAEHPAGRHQGHVCSQRVGVRGLRHRQRI